MPKANRDDVAVFVDFENVYVSVREKFDATPNFELIMDRCEDYGRIVIARAYADWYRYPRVTSALFANGVEPMYVPTYYYDRDVGRTGRPIKNSVDIHLCIDAMRTLYSQPNICKFVLVTGDRDFIPLVNAIRQHGKDVIIIGIGGAASAHLAQSADEFLFYEQIADLKPTPAPPPVEETRRPDDRRERAERTRPERAAKPEPVVPEPVAAAVDTRGDGAAEEAAAPPPPARNAYDTLVDAIKLARQRGFVVNLGSLKVVMRELDSTFHESKVRDPAGKPFSKFKDFVKEAERQGKVQIFTNGTVTEIFLPGEDPYSLSQFAEDLVSQRVERELETELAQAELAQAAEVVEPVAEAQPAPEAAVEALAQPGTAETVSVAPEAVPTADTGRQSFGDREWEVFRSSMSQFTEPVRFADIFNALRGLRNQEVVELTNNELKELVKQAINRGILQRTGRGARAYYRLSSQYRIARPEIAEEPAPPVAPESPATLAQPLETAPEALPADARPAGRRRVRSYTVTAPPEASIPGSEPVTAERGGEAPEPATAEPGPEAPAPDGVAPAPVEAQHEDVAASAVPEPVESPIEEVGLGSAPAEVAKPARRRSRRKPTASTTNGAPAEAVPPTPVESVPEQPAASRRGGAKRRKPEAAEAASADQPTGKEEQAVPEARENGTKRRRRRTKSVAGNGGKASEG